MKGKRGTPDSGKRKPQQVAWGLRIGDVVKRRWLIQAAGMQVPVYRLIAFVLYDWFSQNAALFLDKETRDRFADKIRHFEVSTAYKFDEGDSLKTIKKRLKL